MKIERLAACDLTPLADLFRQFWDESSSLQQMETTFRRLTANPAYLLLTAKRKERLIGFAMGIICEELYGDGRPFMVIEDLIVDKKFRRNGAGFALVRELEKFAHRHNCCQIIFVTEAHRKNAHQFYRSLGYESGSYKGFKKRL
jgi:GNAT superfamily N-acetyltransferase